MAASSAATSDYPGLVRPIELSVESRGSKYFRLLVSRNDRSGTMARRFDMASASCGENWNDGNTLIRRT